MLVGRGSQVRPVIEWDGRTVGTGTVQHSKAQYSTVLFSVFYERSGDDA